MRVRTAVCAAAVVLVGTLSVARGESSVDATPTTTLPQARAPTARSIHAGGYMGVYDKNGPTVAAWPAKLDVIQGSADAQGPLVAAAKQAATTAGNGDAKFVFYVSLTSLDTKCACPDSRFYETFAGAHPEWVLREPTGRAVSTFVPQLGAGRQLAVDVGNSAFVAAIADWALAAMDRYGWDGVFADNVTRGTFFGWSATPINPRTQVAYTTAEYRADVLAALRQLRERFDAKGKMLIGNHAGAWEAETFADPVIQQQVVAMHGVRVEPCVFDYDGRPQSEPRWIAQLAYLAFANQHGVLTQCQGIHGTIEDPATRDYVLATALLTARGRSGIAELNDVTAWWPTLELDLGAPRGELACLDPRAGLRLATTCPSPGTLYAREWENGRVLVNPGATATITVPLGATFLLDGAPVTTVTMRPHSGAVLVRP